MPLTANFLADFSSFLKACADATTSTDELVEAAGKVGASMDQAVAQAATSFRNAGAGVVEFGQKAWSVLNSSQLKAFASDVTSFASGFINEFSMAEAATSRLQVALQAAGQATPEVTKAYADMASNLQSISRFSDEAITDTIALFTTVGKVAPAEMEKAVRATMNLALAMKVDLPTASNIMAKAMASDGESIGKLKTLLGDAYKPGMDFAGVMEAINTKFGGQTLADMQTTAGTMENLKNQMSDINEIIGKALADNLRTVFDWFQKLPEGMQTFIVAATAIFTALAPVLVSLASLASLLGATGLGGVLVTAGEAIATFVVGLLGWPAVIIAAIAALAVGIYFYWDEIVAFLKRTWDAIVTGLKSLWEKSKYWFDQILTSVRSLHDGIKYWLENRLQSVFETVGGYPGKLAFAFAKAAADIVGYSIVPDMVDGIAREFGRLDRVMVAPAWAAADEATAAFAGIGEATLPTLAAGAGGAAGGGVNVTVNMSGMLGTDDPQTRAIVSDLVSNAVMQGMRGGRLLGTA